MDINNLTIKEKAQLVERLTNEILEETQSVQFEFSCERNKKISGLFRTFGSHYAHHARSLNKLISTSIDEEVNK